MTPAERHSGKEHDILEKRKATYAAAKMRNPERWSGNTRNWEPVKEVWLNPDKVAASDIDSIEEAA